MTYNQVEDVKWRFILLLWVSRVTEYSQNPTGHRRNPLTQKTPSPKSMPRHSKMLMHPFMPLVKIPSQDSQTNASYDSPYLPPSSDSK